MTTSWGWIGPYLIVIILAIMVGPLLATLPLFTHTFLQPLRMNAAQVVRLMADGICLLMIWLTAARARQDLHDNGKGQTFFRAILFPSACLLIVLVASRAYEAHGIPVLGPPRQPLYNWLLTGGLIGAATWLTFAWVRHADALSRAFAGRPRPRQVEEEEAPAESTGETRAIDDAVPPAPARAAALPRGGLRPRYAACANAAG